MATTYLYWEQVLREADEIIMKARADGTLDARMVAMVAEMYQKYKDHLEDVEKTINHYDERVVLRNDGVTIKFPDIDKAAEWIVTQFKP